MIGWETREKSETIKIEKELIWKSKGIIGIIFDCIGLSLLCHRLVCVCVSLY